MLKVGLTSDRMPSIRNPEQIQYVTISCDHVMDLDWEAPTANHFWLEGILFFVSKFEYSKVRIVVARFHKFFQKVNKRGT